MDKWGGRTNAVVGVCVWGGGRGREQKPATVLGNGDNGKEGSKIGNKAMEVRTRGHKDSKDGNEMMELR